MTCTFTLPRPRELSRNHWFLPVSLEIKVWHISQEPFFPFVCFFSLSVWFSSPFPFSKFGKECPFHLSRNKKVEKVTVGVAFKNSSLLSSTNKFGLRSPCSLRSPAPSAPPAPTFSNFRSQLRKKKVWWDDCDSQCEERVAGWRDGGMAEWVSV